MCMHLEEETEHVVLASCCQLRTLPLVYLGTAVSGVVTEILLYQSDVVELGLWSMLSTAAVVKTPVTACGGHTTPSDSNLAHTLFATSVDIAKVWS